MTKKEKEDKKDKKAIRVPKVQLTYTDFEFFIKGSGLSSIIDKLKIQLSGDEALRVGRFIKTITSSPDFQSYEELRKIYIDKFNEEQSKISEEKRKPAFSINIPEWQELLEKESVSKIEKCLIYPSKFPKWKEPERIFNLNDMELCENIFEFVE